MHINISHTISSPFAMFSFCSSMGQLLQLHTFTSTVGLPPWEHPQEKKGASTSTIVWSVLGSAAATAVTAAAVAYWYFNSKYRGWKKDLDQLAKSMQQLPGVPTQFDFADIKKATNNFHETIRLGQGGFGSLQVQASCAGGRREEVQPGQQSTLRGLPNRGQCHQPLATQEYRPSRR
jgi:interleukin-1 receptor-associated kinase 1